MPAPEPSPAMASDPGNAATPGPRPGTPSAKARILDVGAGDRRGAGQRDPQHHRAPGRDRDVAQRGDRAHGRAADRSRLLGVQRRAPFDRRHAGAGPAGAARARSRRASTSGSASIAAETERLAKHRGSAERATRLAARRRATRATRRRLHSRRRDGAVGKCFASRLGDTWRDRIPRRRSHRARGRVREPRALRAAVALGAVPASGSTGRWTAAPQFVRPYPDTELSIEGASGHRRPVAWLSRRSGAGVGPPRSPWPSARVADRELASVFSAARPGNTAEAYAFADDGLMLTPSRFAEELVGSRALPERAAPRSRLRDPGARSGRRPVRRTLAGTRAGRPAAHAAGGAGACGAGQEPRRRAAGRHRQPYRSYRGNEVIGAWRWLPPYDIGVIAEISAAETFAALRYLWISFAVIGALRRAVAGRGADVGDCSRRVCSGSSAGCSGWARTRSNASSARAEWRHLSRPPCAAQAADGDQDPEEAGRHRRVHPPLRARGTGCEPAAASEHRSDLRLRAHARRTALLRDGVPGRHDAGRTRRPIRGRCPRGAPFTSCARSAPRCARRTSTG